MIVAFIFFSVSYIFHPARPELGFLFSFADAPYNWKNWIDQQIYFGLANSLVDGSFSDRYLIGFGYPILAIPSIILNSKDSILYYHSFFIPNLLMFLATVYMTFSLMKKSTNVFWLPILGIFAFLFVSPYLLWFVEPWNGHVVEFGIIGIVYFLMRDNDEVTKKSIIFASLLAGWIFAARFVDIIWVLPIFVAFFIFKPKKMLYFFPCIIIIGLILFSYWIYFDDALIFIPNFDNSVTEYDNSVTEYDKERVLFEKIGIDRFNLEITTLGSRTFCLFFNPPNCIPPETGDSYVDNWWFKALDNKIPLSVYGLGLLVFSPLGIFLLLRKYEIRQKSILVGLLIGFLSSFVFYTSIYSFSSGWTPFFRYHIIWIPVFAVFSIYGLNFVYQKIRFGNKEN